MALSPVRRRASISEHITVLVSTLSSFLLHFENQHLLVDHFRSMTLAFSFFLSFYFLFYFFLCGARAFCNYALTDALFCAIIERWSRRLYRRNWVVRNRKWRTTKRCCTWRSVWAKKSPEDWIKSKSIKYHLSSEFISNPVSWLFW